MTAGRLMELVSVEVCLAENSGEADELRRPASMTEAALGSGTMTAENDTGLSAPAPFV